MADDTRTTSAQSGASLLTPVSRAVSGLALAVSALLGQSVITSGLQLVLMGRDGTMSGPFAQPLGLGLGAAVPALLALALVWQAARAEGDDWTAHLSRAGAIVSIVALVGVFLTVVGTFLPV